MCLINSMQERIFDTRKRIFFSGDCFFYRHDSIVDLLKKCYLERGVFKLYIRICRYQKSPLGSLAYI